MPDGRRVNALRSTARSGAKTVESNATGAGLVVAGSDPEPPHAASVTRRTLARPRAPKGVTLLRVVDRRAQVRVQRRVAADDRVPRYFSAVAAAFRHDFHAFR